MIRAFKIKAPKDTCGYYIIPDDVLGRDNMISNLRYHKEIDTLKNLMFAIICVVNDDVKEDVDIDGWTLSYVRLNNVAFTFDNFFLDEKENVLYDMDDEEELIVLQRQLKLKKLKR